MSKNGIRRRQPRIIELAAWRGSSANRSGGGETAQADIALMWSSTTWRNENGVYVSLEGTGYSAPAVWP